MELYPKLRTQKVRHFKVDRVVNKTRRRRQRSSSFTTPTGQLTSRTRLFTVGQL